MMFAFAARNGVALRFRTVEELREAYRFEDLRSFLDLYYEGASVLRRGRDFFELTAADLLRARAAGVRPAGGFFDPPTPTPGGNPVAAGVRGVSPGAARGGEVLGTSSELLPL